MHQNYIEDCLKDGGCTEEEIKECLCNQNRILKMRQTVDKRAVFLK